MAHTAAEARADLAAAISGGIDLSYRAPAGVGSHALRRSAVLMLFGTLDQVPAACAPNSAPETLDVLLTRRADSMRHHPGQIAFPGGGSEPGDTDLAATALREAAEETGLDPSGVEVLGALSEVHIPVSNNLVTPMVGWWRLPSEVAADHSESVEVFRVPVAELLNPAARGTFVVHRGASQTFRGPAFSLSSRFGGHLVWGFTAIVLSSLFESARWAEPWDPGREFPIAV